MVHILGFIFLFIFTLCKASPPHDVIVVGGGIAGLAAGKYFHSQKKDFVILEGNDYLGGRVQNKMWQGASIPLGAGWIHSVHENHIVVKLAKKYNMATYTDSYDVGNLVFRYGHNGTWIPQYIAGRCKDLFYSKVDQMQNLIGDNPCKDMDILSGLKKVKLEAKTPLEKAMEYFLFDFENAIEPTKISARTMASTSLGHEWIVKDKRGYAYPFIEESRPYSDRIYLNKIVTNIDWMYNKVYRVKCKDGSTLWSKKVLLTVSTGVLKANHIKITPALPNWKTNALRMFPMAHYCKFYLKFNNVFWDNHRGYLILATETKGHYVHWQNFNKFQLFPGSKVLLVILTGTNCQNSHKFTDEQIMDQAYNVLKKVFPYGSRPVDILRNDFATDPMFEGSYSYQLPGINENHYRALEHPIRQSLYFAGEGVARDNFGFTHSAYDNGWEAAVNITKCLNNPRDCMSRKPTFGNVC